MKRQRKKSGRLILLTVALCFIAPLVFLVLVSLGFFGHLQTREELMNFKNATATVVMDENGKLIGKIFSENRTNVAWEDLPKHLVDALIATEDARFFEHRGVDARSLLRVFFKTVILGRESSGGGSTITQQLAKNMFGRKREGSFALLINKTKEILVARNLEKCFTKQEIITLYLNTVSFGESVYGIEAASERYFNKQAQKLRTEESAVLVGILKANNFYNPRLHPENAGSRRNVVLNQMKKYGYLGASETDSLCRLPMVTDYSNVEVSGPADYFLYQVKNEAKRILQDIRKEDGSSWNIETDGLSIVTTLNLELQGYANASFREHLSGMQKKLEAQYQRGYEKRLLDQLVQNDLKRLGLEDKAGEVANRVLFSWNGPVADPITLSDSIRQAMTLLHAGLIAMDPVTGAIKAWVGGIDFRTHPYDQVLARRQLASTFKPVLYAEALEQGIDPCSYLDNDSITLTDFEGWSPSNFDNSYGGRYSLAGALVHSMNIPTFNLYMKVGFADVDTLWNRLGFSFTLEDKPSIAMGTAEASLQEVAAAYSVFANGGMLISPLMIASINSPDGGVLWRNVAHPDRQRVISERTSLLINAILQRAVKEGTGASLSSIYGVNMNVAGKTGTSQNYADAWFAAFNPSLVMVSRVGASTMAIHFNSGSNGSGSALALPLVALTLRQVQNNHLLSDQFDSPFPPLPPDLESMLGCPDFKEKGVFGNVMERFRKEKVDYGKTTEKAERKKESLLRRIFGPKKPAKKMQDY